MGAYYVYQDRANQWRWRYITNGRTIADSGEGYYNKADCLNGVTIMKGSSTAPVYEQ